FPGTLMTLPLVYLIEDQRWIPREAAFMYPPNTHRMVTVWNDHCIKCHSTGPIPAPFAEVDQVRRKVLETGFRSRVGELGIACEACHGPGAEHIRLHQADPLFKSNQGDEHEVANESVSAETVDPIVHPGRLADHERSTQICGQCHGAYIFEEQAALRFRDHGSEYLPGQDLLATRYYMFPPQKDPNFYANLSDRSRAYKEYVNNREFFRQRFWEDGQVLAGGREFTGLSLSACYRRGEISCISCHTLHAGDPNDQLIAPTAVDNACINCHSEAKYRSEIQTHTHHTAGSPGSSCINCHMPHTTYALFSAIRSHLIASPTVNSGAARGAPNACNLCHLDKTLTWTADQLAAWYGRDQPKLDDEQQTVPAGLLWMLKGNAAQRVIAAWHVGWQPAQEAAGTGWMAPVAAQLLADPYGVVRYVAAQSLRTLPGCEPFEYNFLASPSEQAEKVHEIVADWRGRHPPTKPVVNADHAAIDEMLDDATFQRLLSGRDNRPVTIQE
ncbi:MAG: cytochrome c3 family protein, partial [Pirellulales bacterium]